MKKLIFIFMLMLAAMSSPLVAQQPAVSYVVTATSAGRGVLTIENNTDAPCRFAIYSITGQVVRIVTVKPGSERVDLVKGFYIVKSEYGSQKVVVR